MSVILRLIENVQAEFSRLEAGHAEESINSLVEAASAPSAPPEEVELVRELLALLACNEDEAIRLAAVEGLGAIGDDRYLPLLLSRTEDQDWAVRAAAYSSIAMLGNILGAHALRAGLTDLNPIVRKYAAVALYDLVGCSCRDDILHMLATDQDVEARIGYFCVLAACGSEDHLIQLRSLTTHPLQRIAGAALNALEGVKDPVKRKC